MMRKVKIIGLSVFAVLAVTAVSAAAASAAEFRTEKAPATLTATQEENQVFETESGTVTCKKVTGTAKLSATAQPTTTTTSISYSECTTATIFGNINVTVDFTTNNCNYKFYAGPPGKVDLICNSGSEGVIISGPGCKVTVPSQTNLQSISYVNNSNGTVTIVPAVTNIKSTGTGSFCSKQGTFTNGKYKGRVNVKGNNGKVSVS